MIKTYRIFTQVQSGRETLQVREEGGIRFDVDRVRKMLACTVGETIAVQEECCIVLRDDGKREEN
jgi:hypothetical protein